MSNRDSDSFDTYLGDVVYEVWCSGGNPDAVCADRVDYDYYGYRDSDACAASHLRQQRARTEEPAR